MQYKVPQNIDLEDKIIGPLTLIQFLYLIFGGLAVYISFEVFDFGLFMLTGFPLGLLALALAFLKIQDQPFLYFLGSLTFFMFKPRERVWHKELALEESKSIIQTGQVKKVEEKVSKGGVEKSELEKLATVLDTQGWTGVSQEHKKVFGMEDKNIATEKQTNRETKEQVA